MEEQICDPARSPAIVPFRQRGFVLPTPPCRCVPNRSRVLDRTSHCYSLLFIVICAGGDAGQSAQSRAAQGEIRRSVQRPHCYFIVINNAAVRGRRARHQAAPHDVHPRGGRALPLRARCWPSILARFGAFLFTMSNSPVRAGPSALRIVSGRPLRMRIFLAQLRYVVNNEVDP